LERKGKLDDRREKIIERGRKMITDSQSTGRDIYGYLEKTEGFGAETTSKILNNAGFVGIHYNGYADGECYVIFDENDAKIVDHVMFSVTGLITNEQGEIDYDRVTNLAENNEWQQASRIPRAYRLTSVPANAATIISKAVPVEDRAGSEASRQRGDVQGVRQGDRGNNNQGQPDQGGNGTPLGNLADTIKSDIEAWAKSQGYWYDEARLTDGFTETEGGTESRVFVNDDKILETNIEYLGHDYYTDIITFDYSDGKVINGDIIISVDTVFTNADKYGRPYDEELHRVIIHGILHLCGINDKGPGEREIMEAAEDKALALR
jgi:rRNA maturation RNase YbeY